MGEAAVWHICVLKFLTLTSNVASWLELIEDTEEYEEMEVPAPEYDEIKEITNEVTLNKAPGSDNITPELIKIGGEDLWNQIHKLIQSVWIIEEIPSEWTEGIICPFFKKGDRKLCLNCRGITLLNVTYKVFSSLIQKKVSEMVEHNIGKYEVEFRPYRSTTENTHIVRQRVYEKCFEYQIDLSNIFIDFEHTFNSVKRSAINKSLALFSVPSKLIRLFKVTLSNTKLKLKLIMTLWNKLK